MANIEEMKRDFLETQMLSATIGAAFGRAGVYKKGAKPADTTGIQGVVKEQLRHLAKEYVSGKKVSEAKHIDNIVTLSRSIPEGLSSCLSVGRLRIGVAQKALNLYLKYLWCDGLISDDPPHCPLDSNILKKIPGKNKTAWTQLDDIDEYIDIINKARVVANGRTLSAWELELFQLSARKPAV